jgi:ADP-heptose:LPS heptosyltransferase
MNRTLLLHQGALGDLILSLPAIHSIKCGAAPDSLHLISRTDLHELLLSNAFIDGASSGDSGFFAPLFGGVHLPEALKDFLMQYRSVFIFSRGPALFLMERVAQYIPRSFHIKTVPPAGEIVHVSDFQHNQALSAGLENAVPMPALDAVDSSARPPRRTAVILHPGSGGRGKCWPLEYYLDLAAILLKSGGHNIRFLMGPAEGEDVVQLLIRGIRRRGIDADIVRDKPISFIAPLLKSAALYVGNDSGITHLASALGVLTVALFGPTDPRLWGPRGEGTRIVRSSLPCSPCDEERYCSCGERNCLKTIGVDSVVKEIRSLIGDGAARHELFQKKVI